MHKNIINNNNKKITREKKEKKKRKKKAECCKAKFLNVCEVFIAIIIYYSLFQISERKKFNAGYINSWVRDSPQ